MRSFAAPLELALAAIRATARLRPSDALLRMLVTSVLTALAGAAAWFALHPVDAMAQAPSVDGTVAARPASPVDPALKAPASRPDSTKAASTTGGQATQAARRQTQAPANADPPRQETVSTERLVWDKAPLQVALGVGPERERSITFPAQMHIGVPPEVAQLVRVQTVGRTTYVTALAPFPRTRVVAEDRATGAVVLLDLTASTDSTSTQPVSVVVPSAAEGKMTGRANDEDEEQPPVDIVTLTRFAAQQMYAPRRLVAAHPAIRRVMLDQSPLDDLYAGAGVRGIPSAQWRGDEFYVTAVVLQNLQPQPVELNPLDVRGRWRAVTFQHGRLLGKGTEADTTVVYLVCEQPFDSCR